MSNFVVALVGGVFAHISVNMLNEYQDYRSGLDLHTRKTPFSGGSGALPDNPTAASTVLIITSISIAITILIGVYFLTLHGLQLLMLGLPGILLILAYTDWANRHPFICLISPGLGFGLIMVPATQFVLTGEYLSQSWWIALIPFFLTNNLLLLNQYPDIEADRQAGRRHLTIAFGTSVGNLFYGLFLIFSQLTMLVLVISNLLPVWSLLAVIATLPGYYSLCGAIKYGKYIGQHPKYMALNVVVALLTPLMLAITLFLK